MPAVHRWAGRTQPVLVLAVQPDGTATIIDAEGDVLSVESFRIRFPPESLERLRTQVA